MLTTASLKMSHVPYSTNSVNSQTTPVQTVQTQQRPVTPVNTTTPPIYTVSNYQQPPHPVQITALTQDQAAHKNNPQPPTPVYITTPAQTKQTQTNTPADHQPPLTAQQLLHALQPLLIHQHSTITTINALLAPYTRSQSPPPPHTMQ